MEDALNKVLQGDTLERSLQGTAEKGFVDRKEISDLSIREIRIPTIDDRTYWEEIPADYREHLIAAAVEIQDTPWPQILLSDYRDFLQTGNRERYETLFFDRLRMLDTFVLAEAVEDEGRFLDRIMDGLWLLLEQTSWCLPAHNSYVRDTKQDPIPRDEAPVIDLFAAETGATVALTEAILRPRLDAISPYYRRYIASELEKRIFLPYQTYHFWWMGDGESKMLNWTPWITGNVLLTALSREEGELPVDALQVILEQASISLDYFLDEYGEDGCCDEGAQYYSHAGLAMFTALDLLRDSVGELYQNDLIRNIASYIVNVYVGDGNYVNFADCSPKAGRRTAGEYAFGKACGLPALMAMAAEDYMEESWEERLLSKEISLYQRLRQAMYAKEMEMYFLEENNIQSSDVWYESTGLMIARDDHFTLAVKGGDNGDSHNHNDVGSFTLYRDAKPIFIDVGVETYTKKTFSKDRYDIWTMQSQYHNLPTFELADGSKIQQKDGEEYGARNVECRLESEEASITMQLEDAYADPRILSYTREIRLHKNREIVITDHAEMEEGVIAVVSLMTYEKPKIREHLLEIGDVVVFLEGDASIQTEEIPITDARLQEAWKHSIYRTRICVDGTDLRLVIS